MTESEARAEIVRVGRSLFERGYVHGTTGNISVRLDESRGGGFLITPTDACLGYLDPARLSRIDDQGHQSGGDPASKSMVLHARIYATSRRFDPDVACVIHTHSAHCVALTLARAAGDLVPPITPYFVMKVGHVPVIPYHRPGAPEAAQGVADAIERFGKAGTPLRAVMLERLGPNVWHDAPASAMAVLEELEETARLIVLCGRVPDALTEVQIDDLRRTFRARW